MSISPREQKSVVFGITRKSLEAVVVHACPKCEAPGVYKMDDRTKQFWPGAYDPKRNNEPVGAICPNCGAQRSRDRQLGELSASMPKWIWYAILGVKWCVVELLAAAFILREMFKRNRAT